MRTHNPSRSRSPSLVKFLSRDTHDHFVFLWSIPTVSSLKSELSSSYRLELERLCRRGANVRSSKRIGASAHCSGYGIDPDRRTAASFRTGARRFVGAIGIGVPVRSRIPES